MAITRAKLPKEMTPFGKGAKKAPPFGGPPAAETPPAKPVGKKPKFPGFAAGGSIAEDNPTHKAAMASNPPTGNPLDDGKPSGGGQARGGGKATKGKKFQGTF